jgi:membrane protein
VSAADLLERARQFLTQGLWRLDLHPRSLAGAAVRVVQLTVMSARGYLDDELGLRAGALTYLSALSIVPILVVVLYVIDMLGVSRELADAAVKNVFAGSPEAVDRVLAWAGKVKIRGLGTLGMLLFLVSTVLSLRHGEAAVNHIWGVRVERSWGRRFTNYLAVLVVTPVLVGVALSLTATMQSAPLFQYLLERPVLAEANGLLVRWLPTVFLFLGFTFVYWRLPNTRVHLGSAVLGGAVAALLFSGAQSAYVGFNVGAARFSAVFAGFAWLPLLIVWIFISWSIVLLGAEISFAHQNFARYRREAREQAPGPAEREALGIRIAVEVARNFRDGAPPATAEALADRFDVSVRAVHDLARHFERAGIVTRVATGTSDDAFQLGRPAEVVSIADVLTALRGTRRSRPATDGDLAAQAVDALLLDLEASLGSAATARTLAELLEKIPSSRGEGPIRSRDSNLGN